MSDFSSPFAGDSDFQYLALDRKKMLEEAPPYDAKTSCWIPDAKLGYMRSNIQSTKGDDVVVLTEAGEVRLIISFSSLPPPRRKLCDQVDLVILAVCNFTPKVMHGVTGLGLVSR